MIPDRDVWQDALLIVKCHGDDAMIKAAQRADQLLAGGGGFTCSNLLPSRR
jgi:hypothetical protein